MGDGNFTFSGIACGVAAEIFSGSEVAADGPGGFREGPGGEGLVTPVGRMFGELVLQVFSGGGRLGEDKQSGDAAIEPMDEVCRAGSGGVSQIFADTGDEGVGFSAVSGNGEQFGFLVNDDDVRVLEDDAKAAIHVLLWAMSWGVFAALFVADFDLIAWSQGPSREDFNMTIDLHAVVVEESGDESP